METADIAYKLDIAKLRGKKIVLFGAGKCGQDYYLQLKDGGIDFTWLASRPKYVFETKVGLIEEIVDLEYDVALIAISDIFIAAEMQRQLFALGVPKEKIIWNTPQTNTQVLVNDYEYVCHGTNRIIGEMPNLVRSTLQFDGENNILFCRPNVTLTDSCLHFYGNNALVFLNESCCSINVNIHWDSVMYVGSGLTTTSEAEITLGENSNCFIGNDVMLAASVEMRTRDSHLILDCGSKKRINPSKSIFIGDHVWIGWHSVLGKGTYIDSGSIIGASSVVAGKKIGNNCIYAGNPSRIIKKDIFWDRHRPQDWSTADSSLNEVYPQIMSTDGKNSADQFVYAYDSQQELSFDEIDQALKNAQSAEERLHYLLQISNCTDKNRFVHKP